MDQQGQVKHSPGPWEPVLLASDSGSVRHQMTSEGRGAVVVRHDGSPEGFANVCLIAAAPALLEAAKAMPLWLLEQDDSPIEAVTAAASLRAAIAKAEGR